MASFKSHPFFYTSLLLIGAVTAGEAWLLFSQGSEVARLEREIAQADQKLRDFAMRNPFPSRENVALVEADRIQAEKTRSEIRQILRSIGPVAATVAAAQVPGSPTDAYFDIANYVEGVREAAAAKNIALPVEDRLGFSQYASTGPERDLIPLVFRQRLYAEYLLKVLVEAQPAQILSLQRERPLTAVDKARIEEALASGQPSPFESNRGAENPDYFVIDPRVSARVPGFVETEPFRFSFTGTTGSLRAVLNKLALFELPVVVRSVEVQPISANEGGSRSPVVIQRAAPANPFAVFGEESGGEAATPQETVKPLVDQTDSRFTVTVEFVSLVDKSEGVVDADSAANPTPEDPTS
jgi:hypothetical protein